MDKWKGLTFWAIAGLIAIAAFYNFAVKKGGDYKIGEITVDEQAITDLLKASTVMDAEKYDAANNAARLKNATQAVKDKIFIRLAHFNNAKAMVDCDRKVKDIMYGVAEGLKDAGVISEDQYNNEVSSIETFQKSSLFPNLVPLNFCDLAK